MPAALTPNERAVVVKRLHTLGRDRFIRCGLRKTTIANLAKDGGIGKGSFYLFYPSKEALFLAISAGEERAFQQQLLAELNAKTCAVDAIKTLILAAGARLARQPFLRLLLDPETLQLLAEKLPARALLAHQQDDHAFFDTLACDWQKRGWLRPDMATREVFDVLAATFLIALQRDLIGAETAEGALLVLAEAISVRWTSEGVVGCNLLL